MINSIKLKNIRKSYESSGFTLNISDLELGNGNIHVIMGPNGSGKTTLLKLIARLEKPDSGSILFNNNGYRLLQKEICFIMQNPFLFNINVFENIALGLRIRKFSDNEVARKVKGVLQSLEITHLVQRSVKDLSRGEYQKVAIAQVIILKSRVIIMDEPTAFIDTESTLSIEKILKNIKEEFSPIIIMAVHSLEQANRISPNIISIREGRI